MMVTINITLQGIYTRILIFSLQQSDKGKYSILILLLPLEKVKLRRRGLQAQYVYWESWTAHWRSPDFHFGQYAIPALNHLLPTK